ncbi:MAG: hypothetical protein ABEJ82_09405 [Haloplanus sp.]
MSVASEGEAWTTRRDPRATHRGTTRRTPTRRWTSPTCPRGGGATSRSSAPTGRPYRPPRFADGTVTPPVIERLETELGVAVRFEARDPQAGGEWWVVVDGEAVARVARRRDGGGYTVYELSPDAFEKLVCEAVE